MSDHRFALPISLDVVGRRCVVLGGGPEATDKARRFAEAGARPEVFAAVIDDDLAALVRSGVVSHAARAFEDADLDRAFIVVLTPEERSRAAHVHAIARKNGFLLCSIDAPEHCDFAQPAVVKTGLLRLALSSEGRAPALLRKLREALSVSLATPRLGAFVDALAALRDALPSGGRAEPLRRAVEGFSVEVEVRYPDWFEHREEPEPPVK